MRRPALVAVVVLVALGLLFFALRGGEEPAEEPETTSPSVAATTTDATDATEATEAPTPKEKKIPLSQRSDEELDKILGPLPEGMTYEQRREALRFQDAEPDYRFGCTTRSHRVKLEIKDDEARFAIRPAASSWADEPEKVITVTGLPEQTVAEDCDARQFVIPDGDVAWELRDGGCDRPDSPPPGPWSGKLIIRKKGEKPSFDDCGQSGSLTRQGFTISWRPGHAEAARDDGLAIPLYSDTNTTEGEVVTSTLHTLLSIVGPYVSFAVETYRQGAEPPYELWWEVIDITQPDNPPDLRELFPNELILEAIKLDRKLDPFGADQEAATLDDFLAALDGGCEADTGPDMMKRFAFHNIAENTAFVALGVGAGCKSKAGSFRMVPLTLAMPEQLALEAAFAAQAGTLMSTLAP